MKNYVLTAKFMNMITSKAIPARNIFTAKVSASQVISANHVSDRRYAKGEITLKDPNGKVVWSIKQETEEPLKKK